jgi:DNA-binding MarR family transcriptional regulator
VPADHVEDIARELSALFAYAERARHRTTMPELGRLEKVAFEVLGELVRDGPMRLSDLAGRVRLDLSTVSRQVAALESAELVERDTDADDRRASLLSATGKGTDILARIRKARHDRMRHVVGAWPVSDQRALARLLARLVADMRRADEEVAGAHPAHLDRSDRSHA